MIVSSSFAPAAPTPSRRRFGVGDALRAVAAAAGEQLGRVGPLAGEHVGDVGDLLAQRLRVDAVLGVVGDLLLAAAVGLVDRVLHRVGELVGVHVHLARDVAGGAADGLDERGRRAQEALLVGVEDRDERHLGQVEALAQQVDADEHVVDALRAAR